MHPQGCKGCPGRISVSATCWRHAGDPRALDNHGLRKHRVRKRARKLVGPYAEWRCTWVQHEGGNVCFGPWLRLNVWFVFLFWSWRHSCGCVCHLFWSWRHSYGCVCYLFWPWRHLYGVYYRLRGTRTVVSAGFLSIGFNAPSFRSKCTATATRVPTPAPFD